MAFSRRAEEERQRLEEQRRLRDRVRRQALDRDRQAAEERRDAALAGKRALAAAIERSRERRTASLDTRRASRMEERVDAERRDRLLETLRASRLSDDEAAAVEARRAASRLRTPARPEATRPGDRQPAARDAEAFPRPAPAARTAADPRLRREGRRARETRGRQPAAREPRESRPPRREPRPNTRPAVAARPSEPARKASARGTGGGNTPRALEREARDRQREKRVEDDRRRPAAPAPPIDSAAVAEGRWRRQQDTRRREPGRREPQADPTSRPAVARRPAVRPRRPAPVPPPTVTQTRSAPPPSLRHGTSERPPRGPAKSDTLVDRLAAGSLSGTLPWLRVSGTRIVTLAGQPLTLRGLSAAAPDAIGHERGYDDTGGAIGTALAEAAWQWGANVIRLPVHVPRGDGDLDWRPRAELRGLERTIERGARAGAYTMLAVRVADSGSIAALRRLARHFASEPAVLFELEPGDVGDWDRWTLLVQLAAATLRQVHPAPLCIVDGLQHGRDLTGFPLRDLTGEAIPGIVCGASVAPSAPGTLDAVLALSRIQPVLVTDWGGEDAHLSWGERTAAVLAAAVIGWTAAHRATQPLLTAGGCMPTRFGRVVQRALAFETYDRTQGSAAPATAADF